MTDLSIFETAIRTRVSDGKSCSILKDYDAAFPLLIIVWPQLGDFDSLEYAWWLRRDGAKIQSHKIQVIAVGIGDRASAQSFCHFTGFPEAQLFIDPTAQLHQELELYPGLQLTLPGFAPQGNAWLNLLLMCAGIGSPGTLKEVLRGYKGDRKAPQLIQPEEEIKVAPLPPIKGKFFDRAGGHGFQRPFELATLRLRNMVEVLGKWKTYVPAPTYMTQRGGTFLFAPEKKLIYEYRDPGILGFSNSMHDPLAFLWQHLV
ncbi:MAG: hypothetical protein HC810_05560 [Acaryochloridaceae cyanobacterium RL_2_7]|nr:hypothetical protein [Acaryochloridaceae cyanobacterium RL_2_7]